MSVLKRYNDVTEAWEPVVVGKQGPSGVVDVTAPITNSGTDTNAVIGIDQTAITVDQDQVTGLTSGTQGFTALSNGTAGISYQPVSHNYIINGAFDIWQRGTSITHSNVGDGVGAITADRMKIGLVDDGVAWRSVTVARSTNTITGLQYSAKVTSNDATVNRCRVRQDIEDVSGLNGRTITFSFFIRRIATFANPTLININGTTVLADANTLSTSEFTRISRTFTGGAASSYFLEVSTVTAANPLLTTTGDLFEITGVQLEAGSVATPFKRHAPSLQGELAACQRYYYRINVQGTTAPMALGFNTSTTVSRVFVQFPATMRTNPTALEQTGTASDYQVNSAAVAFTCSAVPTHLGSTINSAYMSFTVPSGLTSGDGSLVRSITADAFLGWSAEL